MNGKSNQFKASRASSNVRASSKRASSASKNVSPLRKLKHVHDSSKVCELEVRDVDEILEDKFERKFLRTIRNWEVPERPINLAKSTGSVDYPLCTLFDTQRLLWRLRTREHIEDDAKIYYFNQHHRLGSDERFMINSLGSFFALPFKIRVLITLVSDRFAFNYVKLERNSRGKIKAVHLMDVEQEVEEVAYDEDGNDYNIYEPIEESEVDRLCEHRMVITSDSITLYLDGELDGDYIGYDLRINEYYCPEV